MLNSTNLNDSCIFESKASCESFVDLGRFYAEKMADQPFLTWLEDGKLESHSFTFGQLDKEARALAATLRLTLNKSKHSDTQPEAYPAALIATKPGPSFVVAFFGCLYAGIAAVPIPSLKKQGNSKQILPFLNNSEAKIIVADEESASLIENHGDAVNVRLDGVDISFADDWQSPNIDGDTVAFVQYTSGSTGNPKGVVVTHRNLMSNQQMLAEAFNHSESTIIVSWLPVFHDMGLIGNLLQAFYVGIPCILMSPQAFIAYQIRWLEAISKYKATTSGAPNFAYDLCVSRTTEAQREGLDLSSWTVAFNGSEPIRADTITKFTETFADCGFEKETMYPCYGMAEGTLFATGSPHDQAPTMLIVDKDELNFDRILVIEPLSEENANTITLVSSGITYQDCDTRIVCPNEFGQLADNQVGEVWISSASVASGYKNQKALSVETFQATIKNCDQGKTFLRTGDLGFIHKQQLYITGRKKDLIIISGRNHYPQDIESTATKSHVGIAGCQAVAFSIDTDNTECLVVMLYINARLIKKIDLEGVIQCVKRNIAKEHQISLHDLIITETRLPLTSSGKIQRAKSKQMYLHGGYDVTYEMKNKDIKNG
ncbi:MAG: fatty acyl-AMP ligase [Arenicella sp.]|nr:fatty acyl-AMP ligase [Arenicella sp.]